VHSGSWSGTDTCSHMLLDLHSLQSEPHLIYLPFRFRPTSAIAPSLDDCLFDILVLFPQAKKFVESVPKTLKDNLPKDEAEKLKKTLEALGATVSLE